MRQSKAEVFLHLVWATWQRLPLVTPEIERGLYRCIENEAVRLGCTVLGIGGMSDHVHLCVKIPTRLSISNLMNQVKGVSSHFVHDRFAGHEAFGWQDAYAVFSIGPNQVPRGVEYIAHQREHHTTGSLHALWEEVDEPYKPLLRPQGG